jgi:hypothetical protein
VASGAGLEPSAPKIRLKHSCGEALGGGSPPAETDFLGRASVLNRSIRIHPLDVTETPILRACAYYQCANVVRLDLDVELD